MARFLVMPSEWWENNPLSIIESLCAGTPVVSTRMGGIPELIDNSNGLLVPAGDADALSAAMLQAWETRWDYAAIARKANTKYDSNTHYKAILASYNS